MDIRFYCGINERVWNHHPVTPGEFACINPVYGRTEKTRTNSIKVPPGTQVIQDSGAFCDVPGKRLTFAEALKRQEKHAATYHYEPTHRASYDLLIDEVWVDGNRFKRRWSVTDAEKAVDETVRSAQWLSAHRNGIPLILSAQGVDAPQYKRCVKQLLPYLRDGDWLGLGGWCIIGKMPKVMLPVFRETIIEVIPFAAKEGIKHVHIWGVIYPYALGELLWLCQQRGLTVSTDSSGPSRNPAFGQWGYGDWRNNHYQKPPPETLGLDRARHVQLTREWLAQLHCERFCREPKLEPRQLSLF